MAAKKKELKFEIPSDIDIPQIIADAKERYYDDPNVIGVGVGHRTVGGVVHDGEIALIVYVKEKMPSTEVRGTNLIGAEFQGMRTDVVAPFGPDSPKEALGVVEGHHHSDAMSFVDWPRLHDQWQAEQPQSVAWHGTVQVHGDVCVVEDDGSLTKTVGGQQVVDWVQAYKLFRTTHPDIYDFVTFVTDSDNGMPPQGGSSWYRFVFNDTEGIGFGPFDQRASYGSDTLQGVIFMNQGHFGAWRYVMLQEQGHRWGSFARYRDTASGPNKTDHMLGGWGHWALNFDDDRSPMDYDIYDWQVNGSNYDRVSLPSEERTYCNLDLYLMGLLGPTEVGDFNLLSNVQLISGNTYSANVKSLDVQNIIWAEGARKPSSVNSQKLLKHAFVVLTGDVEASHDLIEEVDSLRLRFEEDYYKATKTLGRVDTSLGALRGTHTEFRTTSIGIPVGTGRRQIERTVKFGGPVKRAETALNGFKLDYANDDRNINVIEVDTDVVDIDGFEVKVRVECQYADKNFDDPYSGYVTLLTVAEVA